MEYAKKVGAPYNLLDNSDFRNPVNQRGQTKYTAAGYCLDRWYKGSVMYVNVYDGYITLDNTDSAMHAMYQKLENIDTSKVYTFAIKTGSGILYVGAAKFPTSGNVEVVGLSDAGFVQFQYVSTGVHAVYINVNAKKYFGIEWVALYEGEYTAETLPEYQSKGYGAELAECMRYFRSIDFSWKALTTATRRSSTGFRAALVFSTPMRMNAPTCSITNLNVDAGTVLVTESGNSKISNITFAAGWDVVFLTITLANATEEKAGIIYGGSSGCYMHISADL
jgi:hypothetical protein